MPTYVTKTLAQLRVEIKKEGRVEGSDNLDEFIDNTVNELLSNYAQNNRYFELLVTNEVIPTILNTGTYALPDDFIAMRLVRYKQGNTSYIYTLNTRLDYIETPRGSRPKWYEIVGSNISIFASDDIPANDSLLLDYYKFPQLLTSNSVFPIPKLVAPIKQEAIRRTLIFNSKLNEAQVFAGEADKHSTLSKKND